MGIFFNEGFEAGAWSASTNKDEIKKSYKYDLSKMAGDALNEAISSRRGIINLQAFSEGFFEGYMQRAEEIWGG